MTYDHRSCGEVNMAWEEDVMTQSLVLNALSSIINFSGRRRTERSFFRNCKITQIAFHRETENAAAGSTGSYRKFTRSLESGP